MMKHADKATEGRIFEDLEQRDPELAGSIRAMLFTFEDCLQFDNRSMQTLLKEVAREDLLLALKTASPALSEKIFANVSSRAAEILREDMSSSGPARLKDVEAAQQRIVAAVRDLEADGKLVIAGAGAGTMSSFERCSRPRSRRIGVRAGSGPLGRVTLESRGGGGQRLPRFRRRRRRARRDGGATRERRRAADAGVDEAQQAAEAAYADGVAAGRAAATAELVGEGEAFVEGARGAGALSRRGSSSATSASCSRWRSASRARSCSASSRSTPSTGSA